MNVLCFNFGTKIKKNPNPKIYTGFWDYNPKNLYVFLGLGAKKASLHPYRRLDYMVRFVIYISSVVIFMNCSDS